MIKETEQKENFATGSVRNSRVGKGRFDLIANRAGSVFHIYDKTNFISGELYSLSDTYQKILDYIGSGEISFLHSAFEDIAISIDSRDGKYLSYLHRLAKHYEGGAKIYAPRNWEMGQEVSRYLDSALRHLAQYIAGETDEDHGAAALWNLIAVPHMLNLIVEGYLPDSINDLPIYPINAPVNKETK
jgi:hypothetical protein